jgi:hypothetical protein
MTDFESQSEQVRGYATAMGLSGSAVVDVHPSRGFLRVKVKLTSPQMLPEFMANYANLVTMTLGAMNVQAKVHINNEE